MPTVAEDRGLGHADVLEGDQRRVRRVHAELLEALAARDPGRVHRHEEEREAVVAGVGVRLRHEDDGVGADAVGDVGLGAVDHPVAAVAHRARLDGGDVGAGVGLGDAEAEDLLAGDRGDRPLLLLLLGAEGEDRRHGHVDLDADAHREAAVGAVVELLAEDQLAQEVAALPAVLLGLVEAEEAALAEAREHRVREARLLPLVDVRRELGGHEAPDRRPQVLVLIREEVVAAAGRVVGLQHRGGRHAGALCAPRPVGRTVGHYQPPAAPLAPRDIARAARRHDAAALRDEGF